jgi:hypothetical protein
LRESRAEEAFDELVTQMRTKYVKDLNPNRLDGIGFGEAPSDRFQAGAPVNTRDASTRWAPVKPRRGRGPADHHDELIGAHMVNLVSTISDCAFSNPSRN